MRDGCRAEAVRLLAHTEGRVLGVWSCLKTRTRDRGAVAARAIGAATAAAAIVLTAHAFESGWANGLHTHSLT